LDNARNAKETITMKRRITKNAKLNFLIDETDKANENGAVDAVMQLLDCIDSLFYPLSIIPNR
jgi:uncharacterized lipoprotein YbaY